MSFSLADYDFIFGLEWISRNQVMVAPHLRGILITGGSLPYFVHCVATPMTGVSVGRVSALVLVDGQEEGDKTFMASLKDEASLSEEATFCEKGSLRGVQGEVVRGNALKMVTQDVLEGVESSPRCMVRVVPPGIKHIDQAA